MDKVLSSIAVSPKYFNLEANLSDDSGKNKLMFKAKSTYENPSAKGHYIIDSQDMAIEEYYFLNDRPTKEFTHKRGIRYRNVFYEVKVIF